jgi:hypothetical protein
MKCVIAATGAALALGVATVLEGSNSRVSAQGRAPVVVELFTSEGCSSCPRADALLRRLLSTQPIDGVELLGLGEHVDYWDYQGWRDPFSSAFFSDRQRSYDAAVFRSNRVYTPQLVIDGHLECVASDEQCIRRAILKSAAEPKGTLSVAVSAEPRLATIDIRVNWPPASPRRRAAEVAIAVTEDGLESYVQRGENHGRTLSHGAVVRLLKTVGRVGADRQEVAVRTTVKLDPLWKVEHLRIVAFAQEKEGRRIAAAGTTPMLSTTAGSR